MFVSGRVGYLLSEKGANHYDGIGQRSPFKKASFEKIAVGRIAPKSAPRIGSFGDKMFEMSEFIHVSVYSFLGGGLAPTHNYGRIFCSLPTAGFYRYLSKWWFQIFCIFTPNLGGNDPFFDKSAIFLTNGVGGINHQPVKRVFYIPKTPVCVLGCQNHHDPRWFLQEGPKLRYYEATDSDGEDEFFHDRNTWYPKTFGCFQK